MATKEEIINKFSYKLIKKNQSEITWGDIVSSISSSSQSIKASLVEAIRNKDSDLFSQIIFTTVWSGLEDKTRAEVANMFTDDMITLTDLQKIF